MPHLNTSTRAREEMHYTKRRKQIWEALHPVQKAESLGGQTSPTQKATEHKDRPQNQPQFAAATAAITGEAKRTINQHLARAEAIGDDLPRVQGTSLDKGVELDALARLPEPEPAPARARRCHFHRWWPRVHDGH